MSDKLTGFMTINRNNFKTRAVEERVKDYNNVYIQLSLEEMRNQANRCMDCGTSFCNWGCPLGNLIPDWNDFVYNSDWKKAYDRLSLTSNFPEFTGRVCPALCEAACVLGVNRKGVSIREIEQMIIETAFNNGWVKPRIPKVRTGKKVAVIGSGPSGLAAADDLNYDGHLVTVFEREDKAGGLLRYGIPNYKLEKEILDRRIELMVEAGIKIKLNTEIGKDIHFNDLLKEFDSVVLCCGASVPRELKIPGEKLKGVYFAVDYLRQQTKKIFNSKYNAPDINAKNKKVLVIGGGDTGADCVGTANRQGAEVVYQYEIMPKPSLKRTENMPWPEYPKLLKTTTAHEEGCIREWEIMTKELIGDDKKLKAVKASKVRWKKDNDGKYKLEEIKKSEFVQDIDMVLIAVGFMHTEHDKFINSMNIKLDDYGNIFTNDNYMTNIKGVFSAGDMRTGQSLVVKAIKDGKNVAACVDSYLMQY